MERHRDRARCLQNNSYVKQTSLTVVPSFLNSFHKHCITLIPHNWPLCSWGRRKWIAETLHTYMLPPAAAHMSEWNPNTWRFYFPSTAKCLPVYLQLVCRVWPVNVCIPIFLYQLISLEIKEIFVVVIDFASHLIYSCKCISCSKMWIWFVYHK